MLMRCDGGGLDPEAIEPFVENESHGVILRLGITTVTFVIVMTVLGGFQA